MTVLNGVSLPQLDQQHLVHMVDHLRGNRKRRRTDHLLDMMQGAGFSPERDVCVMPMDYAAAFNHHPCFRFHPSIRSISFLNVNALLALTAQ